MAAAAAPRCLWRRALAWALLVAGLWHLAAGALGHRLPAAAAGNGHRHGHSAEPAHWSQQGQSAGAPPPPPLVGPSGPHLHPHPHPHPHPHKHQHQQHQNQHHSHNHSHNKNHNQYQNQHQHPYQHRRPDQQHKQRRQVPPTGYLASELAERPLVATDKGLVRGVTQSLFTGKSVDAFLGIPFAQPPVGAYRFRHPVPTRPWPGELDASKPASSCYQVNDTFFGANFMGTLVWNANTPLSEDCLYLNIWTPFGTANTTASAPPPPPPTGATSSDYQGGQTRSQNQNRRADGAGSGRAVLVWIFGGGFYSGTASLSLYEGGVLASEEDIIVVSMNYRVSALGFLYLARPDAPGNAGMFDQLMALQWIQDNIGQFGGDPGRVTIFGESAGAVSVSFHLLSPLSRNLFSQAIMQSGAATCPWGSMEASELVANTLQLANLLGCPGNGSSSRLADQTSTNGAANGPTQSAAPKSSASDNHEALIQCLLRADPMSLVSQEVGQTRSILNFPFVPLVDGSFLVEPPAESLAKSNFKRAPVLLGSNYDEGNSFLIYLPEFSHCPGAAAATAGAGNQQGGPAAASGGPEGIGGEQGSPSAAPLEWAAGSELEAAAAAAAAVVTTVGPQAPANELQAGNDSLAAAADQQAANANNQPKPCKPNEFPALSRDDFLRVLKDDLNPFAEHPVGREAIVFEYTNWLNMYDPVSNYDALDKIVGDYYFTCHVNELARRYAGAQQPVFMYYFKHRSSTSPWPKWMGVLHGDEIGYVFGEPLNAAYNYTAKEVELSRRMMKYWANFAKFGGPNSSMAERWPEYADKRQYFELNGDFPRVGRGPRSKQCAFWAHYLPKLVNSFERGQCSAKRPKHHQLQQQQQIPPWPLDYDSAQLGLTPAAEPGRRSRKSWLEAIPSAHLIAVSVLTLALVGGACALLLALGQRHRSSWKLINLVLGKAQPATSGAPGGSAAGAAGSTAGSGEPGATSGGRQAPRSGAG